MKLKTVYGLIIIIILSTAIFLRVQANSNKDILFLDEYLSYIISTINPVYPSNFIKETTETDSPGLYNRFMTAEPSSESTVKQIFQLRKDTNDSPHSNLYYSLLRLSLWKVNDTNQDLMLQRGFYLNMVLFILSFFLFYMLARKLLNNKILIICALGIAFLNPTSIANTLFLRPYQLQETIFILFTLLSISYYYKIIEKVEFNKFIFLISYSVVTALALLSSYFSIFYIALLYLILAIVIWQYSRKTDTFYVLLSGVFSLIVATIIYPIYLLGYISYQGRAAIRKTNNYLINNLESTFDGLFNIINTYLGFWIFLILISIALFVIVRNQKNKKKFYSSFGKITKQMIFPIIALSALLWLFIVFFLAPFKTLRYIVPIIPILSLTVPYILTFVNKKQQIVFSCIFICYFTTKSLYSNELYLDQIPVWEKYRIEKKTPLVITAIKDYRQVYLLAYMQNDLRDIHLVFDTITFKQQISNYDSVFVVIPADSLPYYKQPNDYQIDNDTFAIESLTLIKLKKN